MNIKKAEDVTERKNIAQNEYKAQKYISKEEKKIKNRISFLEKKIEELEAKMKEIENTLANPSENDDIMELTRQYLEIKREVDTMTEEWLNYSI